MRRTQLIATICLLFLAVAVSGHIPRGPLHGRRGHHRFGGHHRIFSPRNIRKSTKQNNSTQNVQEQGSGQPPPAPPPPPPPAPAPANNFDDVMNPARLFGWDPQRVIGGCGPDCDMQNFLLQQEFLIAHNWVRILFKQPLFTWDEKLESAAREYAMQRYDDCKMIHSDLPYGENIFWGLHLHWKPSNAVFFWYSEGHWFDFQSLRCLAPQGHDCGHFTQLVWKDSVRLGCALQHCRDPALGMLIICEYDPPGNFENENPLDDNNAKLQL